MNTVTDVLLAFSEWLDGEGLIVPESKKDDRTHDELVTAFLDVRPFDGDQEVPVIDAGSVIQMPL